MTLPHHHSWIRRLVAGLFLATAGLMPLKVVFACAMMERIVEQCCCDHERCERSAAACEGSATSEDIVAEDHCCAVTFEASDDGSLAVAESVAKQPIKKLWDSSPDLATAPPALLASTRLSSTSLGLFPSEPHLLDGSTLYLLTARLRL
jgi:hypothetical protein